jgi:hypothetical protein
MYEASRPDGFRWHDMPSSMNIGIGVQAILRLFERLQC